MGRRALRKIDPKLDYARFLLEADEVPRPWDDMALFGREAPLEFEIGSGKGLFLESACKANPAHNFFGVEIAYQYARYCASRLAKHGLENGRAMAGDGLWLMREVMPTDKLEAVHVYFPDPWWKKRHHKRRVLNEPFLRDVHRTLRPGGTLHFWTDVKEYYDATLELIAEQGLLDGPRDVSEKPAEHDLDYRTHFERRTRKAGEPVYRSQFAKA